MSHKKLKLDGPALEQYPARVMEIVGRGGPQTFVWIGEEGRGGKYFGAVNLDKLRAFIEMTNPKTPNSHRKIRGDNNKSK